MLKIDEAERIVAAERSRIRQGEDAIAAFRWLQNYARSKTIDISISSVAGSGCDGHKQAMAYLNDQLSVILAGLIVNAMSAAGSDMDRFLGDS